MIISYKVESSVGKEVTHFLVEVLGRRKWGIAEKEMISKYVLYVKVPCPEVVMSSSGFGS